MQQYQTWSVCSCCQQSHEPINKSFKRPDASARSKTYHLVYFCRYINNYRSYTEDYFLHALSLLCCCFFVLFFVVFFVNARVVFFLVSELLWWS